MSKSKYFDIIRRPIITEKSTIVSELGKYIFQVSIDATKKQIRNSIAHVFGVKVKTVNTLTVKGKEKRFKGRIGKRNDYKKAVVTLHSGQTIDIAAEV